MLNPTDIGRVHFVDRATQASPRAAEASRPSGEYPSRMNTIGWLATSYVFGMLTVILIVRFG